MTTPVESGNPIVVATRIVVALKDKKGTKRILIMKRSKSNKSNVGYWELPGGTVEQGRHAFVGAEASRELKEETGLELDLDLLRALAFGEDNHILPNAFLNQIKYFTYYMYGEIDKEPVRLSSEHSASGWCTLDQLKKMAKRGKLTPRTVVALEFLGSDLEQRLMAAT